MLWAMISDDLNFIVLSLIFCNRHPHRHRMISNCNYRCRSENCLLSIIARSFMIRIYSLSISTTLSLLSLFSLSSESFLEILLSDYFTIH